MRPPRPAEYHHLFIALVIGLVSIVGGLLARRATGTSFKGDSDAI